MILHHGSGLDDPGRIVQHNSNAPILVIQNANDVVARDLILTRVEGREETWSAGIEASACEHLLLERLQVLENRSPSGSIKVEQSRHNEVVGCLVRDSMTLSVDDRTGRSDWGYAFNRIANGEISFPSYATDPMPYRAD